VFLPTVGIQISQICSGTDRHDSLTVVIKIRQPGQKPSASLCGRSCCRYQCRGGCLGHRKALDRRWQELFYCSRNISVSCI